MASELIVFGDKQAILAPQYLGSTGYYALMAAFGKVYVDQTMHADKRFKSAHRCRIVDTRDEIMLTAPVSHPHGRHYWTDTIVSTHGKWWNNHLTALESAYGRTPFFEFYIDRFKSLFDGNRYENGQISVASLDRECDSIIREILGIDNEIIYLDNKDESTDAAVNLKNFDFDAVSKDIEYYQIRAGRLGFRAGLSIVDLIFNMGTESPLVLKQIALKFKTES